MADRAEFKATRLSNAGLGVGLLLLAACILYITVFGSENQLLSAHTRRGGMIKLVEQIIGWRLFVTLMLAFAAWLTVYALVSIWKAVDPTPDVVALSDRLEFHPAVRRASAHYDEISRWYIEFVSGHPVVWIEFIQPYWSLQGLVKRKTVKLEGGKEDLEPLVNYFARHPIMSEKFSN